MPLSAGRSAHPPSSPAVFSHMQNLSPVFISIELAFRADQGSTMQGAALRTSSELARSAASDPRQTHTPSDTRRLSG